MVGWRGALRSLALMGTAVLVSACALPASLSQSHRARASSPLAKADQLVWTGHFDAAESAYLGLAAQGSVVAQAHYSALLDYEGRLAEAVTQASQAVQAEATSDTLAHLSQALDWAGDFSGALAAGAQAVSKNPASAVAHLYYSEALGDAGYLAAAGQEIVSAERLPQTAFIGAEIDREKANLDRDRGNLESELNWLEIAEVLEPSFPLRALEVADFRFLDSQASTGTSEVARVVRQHPADAGVLLAAASSYLVGSDAASALTLYQKAASIRPSEAAYLGLAETEIATSAAAGRVETTLASEVQRQPEDWAARDLLGAYFSQILKRPAPASLPGAQAPDPSQSVRDSVIRGLSQIRAAAGEGGLAQDPALDAAAQAQAYYLVFNLESPSNSPKVESPGQAGYLASDFAARDAKFGFQGTPIAEVEGRAFSVQGDLQGWSDSVFERQEVLSPLADRAGFAQVDVGPFEIAVLDLGGNGAGPALTHWPSALTRVPPAFMGGDESDPLSVTAAYPSGYPITIESSGAALQLGSSQVTAPGGAPVAAYEIGTGTSQVAIVPDHPLSPLTTYRVSFTGSLGGKPLTLEWSFTVAGP